MTTARRYQASARIYDVISAEPVYRLGRRLGIDLLDLQPGDTVVEVGCGTGLNFELVRQRIGATGTLVGVDASSAMLAQAARRIRHRAWTNVRLVRADATTVDRATVVALADGPADAVLATYALSLMPRWRAAWATMLAVARPAARLAVVDMQPPVGVLAPVRWLARLSCWLGGADLTARPWTAVEDDCESVRRAAARRGHLQIRAGRRPVLPT